MTLVEVVARALMQAVGTDWEDVASKQDACAVSKAAIRAILEEGFVIMPREVDESMKNGFYNALLAWKSQSGKLTTNIAGEIYKSFIEAAPDVLEDDK